jgi:hypothetical protein
MTNFDPNHFDPSVLFGVMGIVILVGLLVGLALCAVICYLVSKCYEAIPANFRAMTPGKVWLMMIPCFNIVWIFFVYPGLSKSFKAYFDSVGDTSVGDCYAKVALGYCIATCCCIIPCVNYVAGPASLVLLIVYLVKAYELKNKIKAA